MFGSLFAWCRNGRHCAICWQMFFMNGLWTFFTITVEFTVLCFRLCGHFRAQRMGQYIFLKSPAQICHVIREGIFFLRDCLSCDLKRCFSTSSYLHVLGSQLTAAKRRIVLQFRWDPLLLSRAWYIFGKIVPCSQIDLCLIVLNHKWLHLHENTRRQARAV